MLKLLQLANFISFLPFAYGGLITTKYISETLNITNKNIRLEYIIFFFASLVSSEFLKKIFFNTFEGTQRPKDAKGCDFFSIGPKVGGKPGFPSGHMSVTSFVCVYNIIYLIRHSRLYSLRLTLPLKTLLIVTNIVIIGLMAWARHFKKCHNFIQIIGGTILGTCFAALFAFIK